ncbi:MAG TPA: branched-chain amino acid ABC transporter permease [Geminicoccaceae bacterium]|nr:branched-chain amino acid ABC transporter permease [Geminicoccaceae bacterium]
MAGLTRGRLIGLECLVAAIAFPHVMQALGEPFYISLATRVLIFALAAISLDLILGYGGLVSLGHAAFMGIGGYTVGILFHHDAMTTPLLGLPGTQSAFVVWPLAVLLSGLAALAIGAVCLRTRGIFFIMITLAFAQMLFYLFISLRQYGGEDGIPLWSRSRFGGLIDLESNTTLYYVCLAILAAVLAAALRLVRSPFFQVIRGAKDNERRMIALGYPVFRYQLAAFTLSGMLAGLAGVLLANATGFIGPAYMEWVRSGELIVMVVLGGMGTVVGPVIGAAALLLLEEFIPLALDGVRAGWGEHWRIVLGPLLLLIVLTARQGLLGLLPAAWTGSKPR